MHNPMVVLNCTKMGELIRCKKSWYYRCNRFLINLLLNYHTYFQANGKAFKNTKIKTLSVQTQRLAIAQYGALIFSVSLAAICIYKLTSFPRILRKLFFFFRAGQEYP